MNFTKTTPEQELELYQQAVEEYLEEGIMMDTFAFSVLIV